MFEKQYIVNLAKDLASGKISQYSANLEDVNPEQRLREALAKLMDYSLEGNGKIDRKTFRANKIEIFEIIEEVVNETIHSKMINQFDSFVEYRNLAWGDENLFTTPTNDLFRVALVSDGNANIRRQRLREGQEFSVSLDTYAVKIGEELGRFLAGRIDWAEMIRKIGESFAKDLNQRIYRAILSSYGKYNGQYHMTANITEDQLVELAMHIEARTGEKVKIYGTKLALRKVAPSDISDRMKDEKNSLGYYGEIAGIELREIAQTHAYEKDDNGYDKFAIDNDMLLLLPENVDKMIKVINEGDSIIQDNNGGQSSDMMIEYFVSNKFGISVITSKVFGFVKLA